MQVVLNNGVVENVILTPVEAAVVEWHLRYVKELPDGPNTRELKRQFDRLAGELPSPYTRAS